jgi:hypothetical protein
LPGNANAQQGRRLALRLVIHAVAAIHQASDGSGIVDVNRKTLGFKHNLGTGRDSQSEQIHKAQDGSLYNKQHLFSFQR